MGSAGRGGGVVLSEGSREIGERLRCLGDVEAQNAFDEVAVAEFLQVQKRLLVEQGFARLARGRRFDRRAVLGRRIRRSEVAGQQGAELHQGERLGEHAVHVGRLPGLGAVADDVGGKRDDRHAPRPLPLLAGADGEGRAEPVQHRHAAIHQDEVEALRGGGLDGGLPVLDADDVADAEAGQRLGGDLAVDRAVVGQEHPRSGEGRQRGGRPLLRGGRVEGEGRILGECGQERAPLGPDERPAQQGVGEAGPEKPGARRVADRHQGDDAAGTRRTASLGQKRGGIEEPVSLAGFRDAEARPPQVGGEDRRGRAADPTQADALRDRGRAAEPRLSGLFHLHRDARPEGRALAKTALHADPPAHRRDQTLGDREAEPGAAEAAGDRLVGLGEGREDSGEPVLRDADPGIGHGDAQDGPGRSFLHFHPHQDVAGGRELERVRDEVAEHLTEPDGIAEDGARHAGIDQSREVEPRRAGALGEQGHDGVGDLVGAQRNPLHLQAAGLHLREIEDVVDDGEQRLAGARDDPGVALLARRQVGRGQEFGHHQHAVHRRADLVAHRREKGRLGGVGVVGGLLGLDQVVGPQPDLLLQARAVAGDRPVALVDRLKQAVEARRQRADLAAAGGGAPRVVVALAHVVHRPGERGERPGDAALQAHRDGEAEAEGEQAGEQGRQADLGDAPGEIAVVRDQHDPADGAGVLLDRNRHAQGSRRHQVERRHRALVEVDVVGQPQTDSLLGEDVALAPLDRGVDQRPAVGDGPQGALRGGLVALARGLRRARGEDLRGHAQHLALGRGVALDFAPGRQAGQKQQGDGDRAGDGQRQPRGERAQRAGGRGTHGRLLGGGRIGPKDWGTAAQAAKPLAWRVTSSQPARKAATQAGSKWRPACSRRNAPASSSGHARL